MLYLMMDESNCTVKVGYSSAPKERRKHYKTHNPSAIMRSVCAGDRTDEAKCKRHLAKIGNRIKGTEYFTITEENFLQLYAQGFNFFQKHKGKNKIIESF